MFLVSNSGILIEYNSPTWYLSAMFICMLPLAYMLYRHRDFTLYVFSPLAALISFGYMCISNNFAIIDRNTFHGIVIGGIIRALCGLCFGITAWLIYDRIIKWKPDKNGQIFLTISEVLIYIIFFVSWFIIRDVKAIDSTLLILPIALAITFSGKSYIGKLFRFKWMKYFAPASLAIYLNHWAARNLVVQYFPGCSYKKGVALMAAFTAVNCAVYFALIALGKLLWNKKLKKLFVNKEKV
ncbi:MAG: hypothetical protein J1F04_02130 [Oscillospiraceae bacterium]|nr:hypothetical protein [Oscillospiraceae bacterium]